MRLQTFTLLCMFVMPLHAAASTVAIVDREPPAPIQEPIGERENYIWAPGSWKLNKGRLVWYSGRWLAARPGYLWVPDGWLERNEKWYYTPGFWAADEDNFEVVESEPSTPSGAAPSSKSPEAKAKPKQRPRVKKINYTDRKKWPRVIRR